MFNKPSPRLRPRMQAEVRKRIEDLAPGGGFVFAATQAIQSDTPPKTWPPCGERGNTMGLPDRAMMKGE